MIDIAMEMRLKHVLALEEDARAIGVRVYHCPIDLMADLYKSQHSSDFIYFLHGDPSCPNFRDGEKRVEKK